MFCELFSVSGVQRGALLELFPVSGVQQSPPLELFSVRVVQEDAPPELFPVRGVQDSLSLELFPVRGVQDSLSLELFPVRVVETYHNQGPPDQQRPRNQCRQLHDLHGKIAKRCKNHVFLHEIDMNSIFCVSSLQFLYLLQEKAFV